AMHRVVEFVRRLHRRGKADVPNFKRLSHRLHPPRLPLERAFRQTESLGNAAFRLRRLKFDDAMFNGPLFFRGNTAQALGNNDRREPTRGKRSSTVLSTRY